MRKSCTFYLLSCLWLLWPNNLQACAIPVSQMRWDAYGYADDVLRAKVVGYHYDGTSDTAFFDFAALRRLDGSPMDSDVVFRRVSWQTPGGQPPPAEWTQKDVIIGLRFLLNEHGTFEIHLIDAACGQSYVLDDTQQNRRLVQSSVELVHQQRNLQRMKLLAGISQEKKTSLDLAIDRIQALRCEMGIC